MVKVFLKRAFLYSMCAALLGGVVMVVAAVTFRNGNSPVSRASFIAMMTFFLPAGSMSGTSPPTGSFITAWALSSLMWGVILSLVAMLAKAVRIMGIAGRERRAMGLPRNFRSPPQPTDHKAVVQSGLNGLYADRVSRVSKNTLMVYAGNDLGVLKQALEEWEQRGFIRRLRDISTAADDEECVELLSFIPVE